MTNEQKLRTLVSKILELRAHAVDWRAPQDCTEIERFISVNNNAGREEVLYQLLCWIEDNEIYAHDEPIHSTK